MNVLDQLNPEDYKKVLHYFALLSSIPRGSGNNRGISDFLVSFAKEHGLRYVQDQALNVILYKPAAAGYEEHPTVILQGHMDMVCVKTEESLHDFTKDPLRLFVEGDFIGAKETTLGGDNGIAIAYCLALLADDNIAHPALECLITTDEETGMDGAKALDASLLKGSRMINLDSDDEGIVLCSCAGGLRVHSTLPFHREEDSGAMLTITIKGLLGGHSGSEIHKNRSNAVVLAARLLYSLHHSVKYRIVSLRGGEKDNAIPNLAEAVILVDPADLKKAKDSLPLLFEDLKRELSASEPGLIVDFTTSESERVFVVSETDKTKLLFALLQAPNGVLVMSSEIPGLVESSANLGIFYTTENNAVFHHSVRSSKSSYKHFVKNKLMFLFSQLDGESNSASEYPAWEYKKDSFLRERYLEVFRQMYGYDPKAEAIHAGLECGLVSEKIKDLDIISFGPNMHHIHTPKERLEISSTIRVYRFLEKLLENL